ncbi:MAG: DivIVA domain-containing protein, partial [Lawsonibacter sp.]|nr:DivIVA domain-containing protein [Lawsonibacter sp.]
IGGIRMLTPQEVSERAFQKASFGGYNMSQVDEFLDLLTGDYSTLYSENAVLKSKMKVLVDKVEEYRSTEEAMRKALMTAQRMADDLVKEAEQKKAEILQQAEGEVLRRKEVISLELEAEAFRLQKAQQATVAFVENVRALQAGQEKFLSDLQNLCPETAVQASTDPIEETAEEIDDNVQRLLAQAMMDATAENLKSRREEEDEEDLEDTAEFSPVTDKSEEDEVDEDTPPPVKSCRIDFGTLQFGRDYEIK